MINKKNMFINNKTNINSKYEYISFNINLLGILIRDDTIITPIRI